MATEKSQTRYFVAKVDGFPSLRRAVQSCHWACADRTNPPQPRHILAQAVSQGNVVVIFSVSNCRGWHGYADMVRIPGKASLHTENVSDKSDSVSVSQSVKTKVGVVAEKAEMLNVCGASDNKPDIFMVSTIKNSSNTECVVKSERINTVKRTDKSDVAEASTIKNSSNTECVVNANVVHVPDVAAKKPEHHAINTVKRTDKSDIAEASTTKGSSDDTLNVETVNVSSEIAHIAECNINANQSNEDVDSGTEPSLTNVGSQIVREMKKSCEDTHSVNDESDKSSIEMNSQSENSSKFHYFDIKWKLNYLEFGEKCLSSKLTEDLICVENPEGKKITVNKCRNWQELDGEVGEWLCEKMQVYYDSLCQKRDEQKQREMASQVEPFYKETKVLTVDETWRKIVAQVELDLGKVILACPFGSQRYNLHTPDSDTDMFIVYQARTKDVLGFSPPKQTIKNQENESCDYTIHEVYRYCELLLSGDARCVETLFLHECTVVQASIEWQKLKHGRRLFLNRECLDKYLRDAQGSKGTKYLQKWCTDHAEHDVLPPKMCKMLYVIVRLLQNARHITDGRDIEVYREKGSAERDMLMTIRAGHVSISRAWEIIKQLEKSITDKCEGVAQRGCEAVEFLENWLLTVRYEDLDKPRQLLS